MSAIAEAVAEMAKAPAAPVSTPAPAPKAEAAPATPKAEATPKVAPTPEESSAAAKATKHINDVLGNKPAAEKPVDGDKAKPGEKAPKDMSEEEISTAMKTATGGKAFRLYEAGVAKANERAAALEKRITEMSSAKPQPATAPDEKVVTELQGRIKDLETRLHKTAYSESDEFKEKYMNRYANEYKAAVEGVGRLQVRFQNGVGEDGQPKIESRPATEADFARLLKLDPADQDAAADQMFGPSARRVQDALLRLDNIKREGTEAIASARKTHEAEQAQAGERTKAESQKYTTFRQEAQAAIEEQWPDLFKVDHHKDDPEAAAILKSAYDYVDDTLVNSSKMPLEDRAAANSVIRARAAAMPLVNYKLTKAMEQVKSLKEELSKLRGTTPGAILNGDKGGDAPKTPDITEGGIRGAAMAFKRQ